MTDVTQADVDKAIKEGASRSHFWMDQATKQNIKTMKIINALRDYLGIKGKKNGLTWLSDRVRSPKLIELLGQLKKYYSAMEMDDE